MNLDECVARACEPVPGLVYGALVLLPEGLLIGGVGEGGQFEREPLARSAARCLAGAMAPRTTEQAPFIEHVLVGVEELVVILRGQRYPQLALALVCSAEANLTFVLSLSRTALRSIEATVDLAVWEL
jgi:hypothetical protein